MNATHPDLCAKLFLAIDIPHLCNLDDINGAELSERVLVAVTTPHLPKSGKLERVCTYSRCLHGLTHNSWKRLHPGVILI